jgi:DNA polymerase-1
LKKLYLLDAMALIYRAYFAYGQNPRITSKGVNTSAIFGFTQLLFDVIQKDAPTHLAVAFDTSAPTFRHEKFNDYKAHREEMPDGIRSALPYIKEIIKNFGIPLIEKDGFEADDLIGTMAKKAEKNGYHVYMMTSDKDYAQVVSPHIFLYKPARQGNPPEILDPSKVCEQWNISEPSLVADVLGLWGDAVDNIPGVAGIGEKSAKELVGTFGSIENIFENLTKVPSKFTKKLQGQKEHALLCKELATIHLDCPIEFDEEALTITPPHLEAMEKIFLDLEFRSLLPKLKMYANGTFDSTTPSTSSESQSPSGGFDLFNQQISATTPTAEIAETEQERHFHVYQQDQVNYSSILPSSPHLQEVLNEILSFSEFCFDTETTGIDALTAQLVGLSFSTEKGKAWYIPLSNDREKCTAELALFQPLWSSPLLKIGQNIKYDLQVLHQYGYSVQAPFFDTMLAHYLLEPDQRHSMDRLSEQYLGYSPISIETLIGKKGKNQGSMQDVPLDKITPYACEDADVTLQLKQVFDPMLKEKAVNAVFYYIEIPLVEVLRTMEEAGVAIDIPALHEFSDLLFQMAADAEKEIYQLAGTKFNIASPKQLGDVLFQLMQLDPKAKKTATGQYKTDEEVLQRLADQGHGIAQKVLEFRGIQKLKSTYVDALPQLINPQTGRVHTHYQQAVAATGRLSSNNPNLQNIPIRTELGKEVRKAFIPREKGRVILSADYSQIELRLITEISGDAQMLDDFRAGHDIHTATAAQVFKCGIEEVTSDLRRKAKTVNFGIIYGISAFGLSQRLGIPRGESAELIKRYFETYPGIKTYMEKTVEDCRINGFVSTMLGRKRMIPDINSANATVRGFAERNAINAPIQGSAADLIKLAMIKIHVDMKSAGLKSQMIMQVHDELVFDAFPDELEVLKSIVKKGMETVISTKVPILVEMGVGENWLEAH